MPSDRRVGQLMKEPAMNASMTQPVTTAGEIRFAFGAGSY